MFYSIYSNHFQDILDKIKLNKTINWKNVKHGIIDLQNYSLDFHQIFALVFNISDIRHELQFYSHASLPSPQIITEVSYYNVLGVA